MLKDSISQFYLRNVWLRDIHDWHEIVYSIYMYITNRDKENHLHVHFHYTNTYTTMNYRLLLPNIIGATYLYLKIVE